MTDDSIESHDNTVFCVSAAAKWLSAADMTHVFCIEDLISTTKTDSAQVAQWFHNCTDSELWDNVASVSMALLIWLGI